MGASVSTLEVARGNCQALSVLLATWGVLACEQNRGTWVAANSCTSLHEGVFLVASGCEIGSRAGARSLWQVHGGAIGFCQRPSTRVAIFCLSHPPCLSWLARAEGGPGSGMALAKGKARGAACGQGFGAVPGFGKALRPVKLRGVDGRA